MTQLGKNEAAVSETIGYIVLFGIVTLSMGVIYAIGYPVLESNIDANVFESAEQNFIVLQSNMKRVSFDQAPVKTLKMKLYSSELSINGLSSNISIDIDGNPYRYYDMGDIMFLKGKKAIFYEGGSVLKRYPPQSTVVVSRPPIYNSTINGNSMTNIGIVSINGDAWVSGKGITTLTMKHNSSETLIPPGVVDVQVRINSTNAHAWKNYLEGAGFQIMSSSPLEVTARCDDTRLAISRHVVDVTMT